MRGAQTSWNTGDKFEWSLGVFHSLNEDDIIQIANSQQGRGFFSNAGETKRQGIEASLGLPVQRLFTYASYAFIDATFKSNLIIPSENNPAVTTLARICCLTSRAKTRATRVRRGVSRSDQAIAFRACRGTGLRSVSTTS